MFSAQKVMDIDHQVGQVKKIILIRFESEGN